VLAWILIVPLAIIWLTFLLPLGRRRSPTSSVEEFERNMSLLAEANKAPPGRWVLTPRKDQRFMGSERQRVRVRRRRRVIFMALLEVSALSLIIGLFPPLRPMLLGSAGLGLIVLAYGALLVRIRTDEQTRAKLRRAARGLAMRGYQSMPIAPMARAIFDRGYRAAMEDGYGAGRSGAHRARAGRTQGRNGNGAGRHRATNDPTGYGEWYGDGGGHGGSYENGGAGDSRRRHGNGRQLPSNGDRGRDEGRATQADPLWGAGVTVIDDDVHVIVRRREDLVSDGASVEGSGPVDAPALAER
jgi:hypothetical protein